MAQSFKDFAKIIDHLIVGSHPPKAIDIENLFDNYGVRAIENLQERSEDSSYITAIKDECVLKNIWYQRVPIHDIDPISVRTHLPVAVGILDKAIREKVNEPGQTVYLYCHEGLGRSPSVAAAYLYWFMDKTLDEVCGLLREKRTYSTPYRDAIRGATYDILGRNDGPDKFHELPAEAFSTITPPEKGTIQGYVKQRPAVLNA